MSSPARQMNSRRLPPLPGLKQRGSSPQFPQFPTPKSSARDGGYGRGGGFTSPRERLHSHYDMVVTGHSATHLVNGHHTRHLSNESQLEGHLSPLELNAEVVVSFLNDNPEFLDRYVTSHVNLDQVERWLVRKSQLKHNLSGSGQQRHKLDNASSNGDLNSLSGFVNQRGDTSTAKWKLNLHGDKRASLQKLSQDLQNHPNKAQLLSELTICIATAINADNSNLYLVDESGQDLYHYKASTSNSKATSSFACKVGSCTTVAAFVAHSKEIVRLTEILGDDRFPDGVGVGGDTVQSVLAQPIVDSTGQVIAVIELHRNMGNPAFTEEEEESVEAISLWSPLIVDCWELCLADKMHHSMNKQRQLNDFLLAVTKSIFQDIVSMDTVIMKIMNFAQKLVSADRASLFLVDNHTQELYARIFDVGNGLNNIDSSEVVHKEIRFPMDKGVAGYVASTGETLNIPDAYKDDRFNRDVDMQTGYTTKTILCMPILIRGSIIGVVQMVNKLSGTFTKADEESFETFAVYCGLALHHAKLYDKIRRSEQKYKVALEVLSYHSQCSEEEVDQLKMLPLPEEVQDLTKYEFSPWAIGQDEKPLYVIYMFQDLFNMTRFDMENLMKFTLTVRKNYRHVPYHNWAHAFSVAHAMYTVIKTTKNIFNPIECIALYVACLCHDLDHRGKTNAFMVKSASPLAAIYSTSTMEHHHFNQTVTILQCLALYVACLCHDVDHRGFTNQYMVKRSSPLATIYSTSTMEHHHFNQTITILQHEGHNIFKHLTSEEYKKVLGDIKHCILATDLALFFGNRARLKELVEKDEFVWQADEHRHLLMGICMTASDLCSMYKPWNLQVELVNIIMEEFWQQGDEEKSQGNMPIPMMDRDKADQLPNSQGDEEKAQGQSPIAMMDRDKQHELPALEVGFLVGICIPCYELLAQVLPETKPMVDGATANLKKWKELADKQKDESEKNKS